MVTKMKFAREMMKKSFFIVLSVILCVLCFPIIVKADEPDNTKYSAGNFYYHVHEGYVSICGYVGDDTEIIIPSNIAGSPVSEIESKAFDGCDTIETITIPETVDTLYDDSFSGMTSLKKVICNTINVNINVGDGIEVEYTTVLQGNDDNTSKQQGNDETVENPDNKPDKETVNNTGEDTDNGSKDDKSENSDIGEYSYEETDDDANTNSEKATNPENSTNTGNTTNTDVNSSDNVTSLTPANNDSTTIDSIDTGANKTETNDQTIVTSEDGTMQVAEGTGLLISTSDSENTANNDTPAVTGNKKIWIIIIPIAIVIVAIVVSIVLFTKSNKN
jgi:hypothetical protein